MTDQTPVAPPHPDWPHIFDARSGVQDECAVCRRDIRDAVHLRDQTPAPLDEARDPDDESGTFECYCGAPDPGTDGNCRTCNGATYRLDPDMLRATLTEGSEP